MRILSREYKENVRELDSSLRVEKSFDLIKRSLKIGKDEATFYYIDGFVKDVVMQRIMQYFLTLKDLCNGEGAAECFRERHVPYVEVDISTDIDALVLAVLSGSVLGDQASPVSDTTILSAAGAEIGVWRHVVTQFPYVVIAFLCSAAGYLIGGISGNGLAGLSAAIGILAAMLLLYILVRIHQSRKRNNEL
jgi:hypothetical protein